MTILLILILSLFSTTPDTYQCTNNLEIRCSDGECQSSKDGEFTPMSVSFDTTGKLSVCAYTGCWEGTAATVENDNHLLLSATDMPFSTNPESKQNIAIALDKTDSIALVKAGEFAGPFYCKIKTAK